MSTLGEIEKAADALPIGEQRKLLAHLGRTLSAKPGSKLGQMPAPPNVPIEELRRIHAIIEAEFSKVDPQD
jgi:hypothetical protein